MAHTVKADNSRKYTLHGCIYNILPETQFFLIYVLENIGMKMCLNSLNSKVKIDTIKGDRSKVFSKNRKMLNVPVKRFIYIHIYVYIYTGCFTTCEYYCRR
jgi:hypothetical protein